MTIRSLFRRPGARVRVGNNRRSRARNYNYGTALCTRGGTQIFSDGDTSRARPSSPVFPSPRCQSRQYDLLLGTQCGLRHSTRIWASCHYMLPDIPSSVSDNWRGPPHCFWAFDPVGIHDNTLYTRETGQFYSDRLSRIAPPFFPARTFCTPPSRLARGTLLPSLDVYTFETIIP